MEFGLDTARGGLLYRIAHPAKTTSILRRGKKFGGNMRYSQYLILHFFFSFSYLYTNLQNMKLPIKVAQNEIKTMFDLKIIKKIHTKGKNVRQEESYILNFPGMICLKHISSFNS